MLQRVVVAGGIYLLAYAAVSLATGQRLLWLGNFAQLLPPLVFAGFALALARRSRGQVRIFWSLNAAHGVIWAAGQALWTYLDLVHGEVPIVSPTDPIFFASSIPLAAALYGRPDRDRPRWLFDIVVLDLVLIALFAVFAYMYFVGSVGVAGGAEDLYDVNLTQLLNARNLLLAAWATYLWRSTTAGPAWRRMLGAYSTGLWMTFLGGLVYDIVEALGTYHAGTLWDLSWMVPFIALTGAAAIAHDEQLLQPAEEAPSLARLPVVSLIAVALLVAIPVIDEVSRRLVQVSAEIANVRTRLALAILIPFGIVVVVREFLSRRALLRAGQELTQTRGQLAEKEKMAAVGQLVSGIAHELNNPLQGVLGYAELLLSNRAPGPEAEELRAIRDNANRAAGIVRSLLTFAGRSGSTRGWQQVNQIVCDAVAAHQPQLQAAAIAIRTDLADRLPLAYLDAGRFHDVILNLIRNAEAAIATRRAGVSIHTHLPPRTPGDILVSTRWVADTDRLAISVSDNGSGVRQEDLPRVFEPFFTTRDVGEGAGLGLSVCYGIVREHGGIIRAENLETGGAMFVIELPVTAESLAAVGASATRTAPVQRRDTRVGSRASFAVVLPEDEPDRTPRPRKALVVDDEESNAALVRRVLAGAGYDVDSTTLSRRALVMIERMAYDVVIADVKMPELSGQELYSRVCQIRPEMARRFIFITGDIDGEDTHQFLEQSRCSYVMKPFNLDRLTAAVDMMTGSQPPQTIG